MKSALKIVILVSFISVLTSNNITTNNASREKTFRILNLYKTFDEFDGLIENLFSSPSKPVELLHAKRNKRADSLPNEIQINKGKFNLVVKFVFSQKLNLQVEQARSIMKYLSQILLKFKQMTKLNAFRTRSILFCLTNK